jgi:hypothetical protein
MEDNNERHDKDMVTDIMALLSGQPTMAVGEYLGPDGFFKKLDEAVTKARYDNVAAHIQNVVNAIGKTPRPSRAQTIKIRSWSDVAGDIPPTDEARSAIIEAALHDILKLAEASGYEEAANELNDRSAQQLLTAPADDCIEPEHQKERTLSELAALGLISRPTRANLFGQFCASIIGTAFGAIILLELIVPYGAVLLPRYIPAYVGPDLIIDAAIISALFATAGILVRAQKYWLTEFGKSIQGAAKPFFKLDKSLHKRLLFASVFNRPLSVAIGLSIFLSCILPVALQLLPKELRYLQEPPVVILTPPPSPASSPPPAPSPPKPTEPSPSQVTLPAEDVYKLINVWKSVSAQLENTIELPKTLAEIIERWHRSVDDITRNFPNPVERQQQFQNAAATLNSDLSNYRARFLNRRASLGNIANTYSSYPNISNTLNASTVDQKFNRHATAIENLRNELSINPNPLNVNSASALKPFQDEVENSQKDLTTWASQTRDFADRQIKELSKAVKQP